MHPSMSPPDSTLPSNPHLVGIIHFFREEKKVNDSQTLNLAFQGKGGLGKSQCMFHMLKDNSLGSQLCLPVVFLLVDAVTLFSCWGPSLVASVVQ